MQVASYKVGVDKAWVEAVDAINSTQAEFSELKSTIDLVKGVRVNVLEGFVDNSLPIHPSKPCREEAYFSIGCKLIIERRSNQPDIGKKEAAGALMKLLALIQI